MVLFGLYRWRILILQLLTLTAGVGCVKPVVPLFPLLLFDATSLFHRLMGSLLGVREYSKSNSRNGHPKFKITSRIL